MASRTTTPSNRGKPATESVCLQRGDRPVTSPDCGVAGCAPDGAPLPRRPGDRAPQLAVQPERRGRLPLRQCKLLKALDRVADDELAVRLRRDNTDEEQGEADHRSAFNRR